MSIKRNCFCCNKKIKTLFGDDFKNPPDDATAWQTSGNYGSTMFDSFNTHQLEIYICDVCLKKKMKLAYCIEQSVQVIVKDVKRFDAWKKGIDAQVKHNKKVENIMEQVRKKKRKELNDKNRHSDVQ